MNQGYFYCYSGALMHFLKSQGLSYTTKSKNSTGKTCYLFQRSEELDEAITKWQNNNPRKQN